MIRRRNHSSNHQIDMTTGPLFINIIRFILPLIATNLLQQFYHSADIIIVGLSPELDAVGAVGSTGAFLALIRNIFIGCSVGANIVVARCIGSDDREKTSHTVHTSVCMSLLLGMIGAIIGIVLTRPILIGMGYTENLLELAVRYSYIYLACMPFFIFDEFSFSNLAGAGKYKNFSLRFDLNGIAEYRSESFLCYGSGTFRGRRCYCDCHRKRDFSFSFVGLSG